MGSKKTKEAIDILQEEQIDLVILDINLGENEEDGISLAKKINEEFPIPFIFLTAYGSGDIIKKAIETHPLSYITKTFKTIDLINSIEIALAKNTQKPKEKPYIVVRDGEYLTKLPIEEIFYIESNGNYLYVYTQFKKYKLRSTIKQILEVLNSSQFVQTHRAFVINKSKIQKFSIKNVIINEIQIPVSKKYMKDNNLFQIF